MKKKITYIVSQTDKSLAFEWIASLLDSSKFELNFILIHNKKSHLEEFLLREGIKTERISYSGKKNILKAIWQVYRSLKKNKTTIIHTHLFEANIIGLIAGYLAFINRRIYTRHHSNYHWLYYPGAIKYDKLCNWLATDIVAITEVTKKILIQKEHVASSKISLINHGFDLSYFENPNSINIEHLKIKYNPHFKYPVIGVISRYTEWKGIQHIIPAFKEVLKEHPDALLILANAKGDYSDYIKKQLNTLPESSYIEIQFEEKLAELYQLINIFVHTPISEDVEAFGQVYIEALATGTPSVFTLSGIANEFIINEQNALVVPYKNSGSISNAIIRLLREDTLRNNLIYNGKKDIKERFGLELMLKKLTELYEK